MGDPIVARLETALGPGRVSTESAVLDAHRHDYWSLPHVEDYLKQGPPPPRCVVRPAGVDDVVAVVNACRETRTPLVPYGLGSGVCGGVRTNPDSVVLDLGALDRVRAIDPGNLLAHFDAGVNGGEAERAVAARGLTIGHWPQSIDVSSVGGWIATRAAGQFSTGYGCIEDMLYSIEAVLPDGSRVELGKAPRAAAGPDLRHLLMGSEGTLGVITGVTLALRRAPERSTPAAFYVPAAAGMAAGFEAQREMLQSGWPPVVLRQYDPSEVKRLFRDWARGSDGLLLALHQGPAARVEAELGAVAEIAERAGLEPAPAAAVEHWLAERNHVPDWSTFYERGVVVDTIEVSAPWDRIEQVYERAVASLGEVDGILNASAHSSHAYRTGVNLYFSFAVRPSRPEAMPDAYRECWHRVMQATADAGGGVAHHHGIGRVRRDYLVRDLGESGVALLRAVKRSLDPVGFMNPGVLIPEGGGG